MTQDALQTERRPLRDYARILWEGRWLVVGCLLVTLIVAALYTETRTAEYSSTSRILVQDTDPGISALGGGGTSEDPDVRAATNLDLASLPALAQRVVDDLNLSEDADAVLGQVEAKIKPNSRLLTLVATDPSPRRAAALANSFAAAFVAFRRDTTTQRLTVTLSRLRAELRNAVNRSPSSPGAINQLREQIATIEAQKAVLAGDSEVVQEGAVPSSPSSPNKKRNYMLATFFGLLLGLGMAGLRDRFDRRIKDMAELRQMLPEVPVLAAIPTAAKGTRESTHVAEAYRTLQANLAFLDVDRPLRSILISGPGTGDGKSTISLHLGMAMAERGQRVLLIDGNLREASLSRMFQLTDLPGVSSYLSGKNGSIDEYVRYVSDVGGLNGGTDTTVLANELWVMPSGPKPPNPGSLLNAAALDDLLDQAKELSDRVIVSGSAIGRYSDMLSLARRADGVLLVVRLNHTRRDEMQNLLTLLRQAQVRPLGLAVVGDRRALL